MAEIFVRDLVFVWNIALIQPDLKTQKSECRLTKEHNLEWTVKLAPGEQRELVVKWTAEYPAQEVKYSSQKFLVGNNRKF
uniref:Uncharacterized protein n=1 Tax=Meloidogyne incognita TaxID=6306 RepID=A0A914MQA6_MELIC